MANYNKFTSPKSNSFSLYRTIKMASLKPETAKLVLFLTRGRSTIVDTSLCRERDFCGARFAVNWCEPSTHFNTIRPYRPASSAPRFCGFVRCPPIYRAVAFQLCFSVPIFSDASRCCSSILFLDAVPRCYLSVPYHVDAPHCCISFAFSSFSP